MKQISVLPQLKRFPSATINVYNRQRKVAVSIRHIQEIVGFLLKRAKIAYDQVDISFVGKAQIKKLHLISHGDASFTDCITFPYDQPGSSGFTFLGEAFICPEAAVRFCKENGGDIQEELVLYVIHTLLHMLGYDDIDPKERQLMRKAEQRWMAALKKADLLSFAQN